MATPSEIVARLTLNAKEFTARFDGAINDAVGKARAGGTQVGNAFKETAGAGLRDFAADVPVVGGALTGLSGAALGAAAGIGAITVAAGFAIANTEEYTQATRGLEAVLKATGNQTGFTTEQLKAFAEEQESALAISAESIIGAEKVLSSFGGVAGSTFKDAILAASDLAAVYGGDLSSNSEKLGVVLQNLAQGNVEGLSKAFKFLGVATLENIANLAESGRSYEAQRALLDALKNSIGGSGAAAGQGVAGAFFRLKDSIGDASREIDNQLGLSTRLIGFIDELALGVNKAAAAYERLGKAKITADDVKNFLTSPIPSPQELAQSIADLGNVDDKRSQEPTRQSPGEKLRLSFENFVAREAAATEKAEGDKQRAVEAAAAAAKKAAAEQERATARAAAAAKAADDARKAREAAFETIKVEGAAKDAQRLALLAVANDNFFEDWKAANAKKDDEARKSSAALVKDLDLQFRYLSDSFYEIFSGRSGNIWGKFKELGARTLSELASQFVIGGKLDLGGTSAGGLLNSLAGLTKAGSGGAGLSGLISAGGAAVGLGGLIGSAGLGAVTIGTTGAAAAGGIASGLAGTTLAGAGAGASGLLGAAAAAGPWALAAAGLIAGGIALFGNKPPEAFQSVTGGGLGALGGVKGKNSAQSAAGATSLGQAGFNSLSQLAASLGGGLDANANLGALGVFKDQFSFDTTPGFGNNRRLFGSQDAAIAAFTQNAISKGVLTGVDASVARLLSSGDLSTQLGKAQLLANALNGFNTAADPTAGAVKALTDEFTILRDVMAEAGSSAADTAKASAEYDKRLQAIRDSAGQATTTLQNFLNDLGFGSSSPLSIGDQAAAARAAYGAQAGRIGSAGFDQSAFVASGQRLLDIEGQLNGRTQDFFAVFNQVQADTNRAISAITNANGITGDNPFARKTADATAATADNTSLMAELMTNLPAQIAAALQQSDLSSAFIGDDARGFAVAA
jgi:hypothetical protein